MHPFTQPLCGVGDFPDDIRLIIRIVHKLCDLRQQTVDERVLVEIQQSLQESRVSKLLLRLIPSRRPLEYGEHTL